MHNVICKNVVFENVVKLQSMKKTDFFGLEFVFVIMFVLMKNYFEFELSCNENAMLFFYYYCMWY